MIDGKLIDKLVSMGSIALGLLLTAPVQDFIGRRARNREEPWGGIQVSRPFKLYCRDKI